jgi:uncharacterized protein
MSSILKSFVFYYMEKLIVFGASGRVGSRLVRYALDAGYEVTAFIRNPDLFPIDDSRLSIFVGNALDPIAMEKALPGHDVVISALGARNMDNPITLMSDAMGNMIDSMKKFGIKRVLAVGGAGILHQEAATLVKDNPDFPEFLQNVSSDHLRVYHLLRDSELEWTMACPPNMRDEERTGNYVTEADYFPKRAKNQIAAGDVADFLLKEVEGNNFIERRVGVAEKA